MVEKNNPPLVSVFMSVFNAWPFLDELVESVLNQSYENFEFIIVDDGSTDEGVGYLDSIDDHRVKVIHQKNQGLGRPLNKWLKACSGRFIMRVDADDLCLPDRIEKQVDYLVRHPEVIMLGCQIRFFSGDKKLNNISHLCLDNESIVKGMMKGWHTMCHASIMFRRTLLDEIEGYVVSGAGEDWAFILDASQYGELANLSDCLYEVRIHPQSSSWRQAKIVVEGFAYARIRANAKLKGKEYPIEVFYREWNERGMFSKLIVNSKSLSSVIYRQAILDKLSGRRFVSLTKMAVAAIIDPYKALGFLVKKIRW